MYSWLVGRYVRHQIKRLLRGDVDGLLRQFADDGELVFPGRNSFAGTFNGKREVEGWLRRFAGLHPEYQVSDVLVAGPPWNTRIAWRLSDRIGEHYANEGMVHMRMVWGKARSMRVFLDTETVSDWERAYPEESGQSMPG